MKQPKKQPYGGITNVPKYLVDRYGQQGHMVKRGRTIIMNQQSMEQISGRRTRNCSVVAVTRVMDYYRSRLGLNAIPEERIIDSKETFSKLMSPGNPNVCLNKNDFMSATRLIASS